MRPKKTPLRMCAGCGEMKPKKELARVVRAPQKEDESGSPLPPEISLDLTGKKPGRGAYLCLDAPVPKAGPEIPAAGAGLLLQDSRGGLPAAGGGDCPGRAGRPRGAAACRSPG